MYDSRGRVWSFRPHFLVAKSAIGYTLDLGFRNSEEALSSYHLHGVILLPTLSKPL